MLFTNKEMRREKTKRLLGERVGGPVGNGDIVHYVGDELPRLQRNKQYSVSLISEYQNHIAMIVEVAWMTNRHLIIPKSHVLRWGVLHVCDIPDPSKTQEQTAAQKAGKGAGKVGRRIALDVVSLVAPEAAAWGDVEVGSTGPDIPALCVVYDNDGAEHAVVVTFTFFKRDFEKVRELLTEALPIAATEARDPVELLPRPPPPAVTDQGA